MIIQCPKCQSMIEYDSSDYELAYNIDGDNAIYIICPVCDEMIVVGTEDEF